MGELTPDHRRAVKAAASRGAWPGEADPAYHQLVLAVAQNGDVTIAGPRRQAVGLLGERAFQGIP